jgi:phosphohistidine phosphatase
MEIYLVRHGHAEDTGPDGTDRTRRLTDEGRKKTAKVAAALRSRVRELGVICHSPYTRAVETAEIFGQHFKEAPLKPVPFLTPYDPPERMVPFLAEAEHFRYVMLVGHMPYLSSLASKLLVGRADLAFVEFKKAAVAGIQWDPAGERGYLRFLLSPKYV